MARAFSFHFTHIASVSELNFPLYQITLSEAFLIQDCPGERNNLGRNFCFPYELPRPVVKHGIARAHFLVAQLNREDATCLIAAFKSVCYRWTQVALL
uniref:Uncharacterized protein n=1 Tax=Solanum tuberosum TaxID=4113 RepID=M0ZZQ7_SOLTU